MLTKTLTTFLVIGTVFLGGCGAESFDKINAAIEDIEQAHQQTMQEIVLHDSELADKVAALSDATTEALGAAKELNLATKETVETIKEQPGGAVQVVTESVAPLLPPPWDAVAGLAGVILAGTVGSKYGKKKGVAKLAKNIEAAIDYTAGDDEKNTMLVLNTDKLRVKNLEAGIQRDIQKARGKV